MDKTFYLGLGGQKCGSSWMQAYLARQSGSDFGRLGEYQIWEADLGSVFARYRVPKPGFAANVKGALKRRLGLALPRDYLRWRMQTDRDEYFTYFADLLNKPGIVRTGDITPSYAALPASMLAGIRDGFEARGIQTRAFFAMRDPVARLRSHMRMDQQKGYIDSTENEAEDLSSFYAGPEAAARMRYDLTLDAIEQTFAPEQRYICLFEEMFTPEGVDAFSAFAEVPADPQAGGQQVNARGSGGTGLQEDLEQQIALHYRPVYEAVGQRLPQIETLWPSARWVLTNG